MNMDKGITLFRNILTFAFLLSLFLHRVEGETLGQTWKAEASITPIARCQEDIGYLLPRDSSNSLVNAPLTFPLTTDSTSTTPSFTSTNTDTSSASSTVVPPPSFPITSTRSVPSFTPTSSSTITSPVSTSTDSTAPSSSETQSSSSSSMTSSETSSSSQSTSIFSSTTPPSSTSSSSSVSLTSTSPPASTSTSPPLSSTQSTTVTSSTTIQSTSALSPSTSAPSTQSITGTSSPPTPNHTSSSSSSNLSPSGTTSSPSLTSSPVSSTITQSTSGGTSTSSISSATQSVSIVSGSQSMSMSDTSSSGTISSSQTFSTTSSPVITGSFSATSSGSSAPAHSSGIISGTGTGTGTSENLSATGSGSSTLGTSLTSSRTSSAPASSSSGASGIGSGSGAGLSRHPNHLSTILSIILPLIFLLFLISSLYLCRRRQLRRGMNVFGQRLELGETPAAWWRLAEPGNNIPTSSNREPGLIKTSNEEKRWHQNQNEVPSSSEKRSVYAIAASVVGRVGVPNNLSHNNNLDALFSDDEKESLNNNFEGGRRTRGGPISTLAASVAKRTHLPLDRQTHRSGSDNRELEHTLPPSSSSTPMSHSPPPSSHFSPSRNHTPFPSFPFTFYRASNSSSRNGSISPVQDVPATASVTDTDVSDQISYLEPVSHNRLIDVLDTEVQIPDQRGYIPIVRTDTRDTTGSSTYSASGMEYIPFMRRDTETDSYVQTAPITPSTRSLNLTRTHTSQSGKSNIVDSQPSPPCENASGIFRASQDSLHSRDTHDSRNTRNTYATQSTVDTTSSLTFAQPKVIRMSASHGNETTLKDETTEIPLITSTFHYSPDPEDESDNAVGPRPSSNGFSAPPSSSKNPFNPSHPLFQPGPPNSADQGNMEGDSFFRTLEWRRRALAYADGTGQRPSLMEAVEVYFSDRKE
ncbi:MAG: hypothetical protein NXY57DRAFT_989044 [Lentinula lateritia]|nr:MAG: hypothetical protein NXY57DRAFT_989044 [Lentinula lateritia]